MFLYNKIRRKWTTLRGILFSQVSSATESHEICMEKNSSKKKEDFYLRYRGEAAFVRRNFSRFPDQSNFSEIFLKFGTLKLPRKQQTDFFKVSWTVSWKFLLLETLMECFRRKFYGKIVSAYRDSPNLPNFVALSEEKTPQEVMKLRNLLPRDPIWKESGQLYNQEGSEAFYFSRKKTFLIRKSVNVEITSIILARWANQYSNAKNTIIALSIRISIQANNRHQDKREKEAWAWANSFRENRFDFRENPLQF